jgi:hypothetical protein
LRLPSGPLSWYICWAMVVCRLVSLVPVLAKGAVQPVYSSDLLDVDQVAGSQWAEMVSMRVRPDTTRCCCRVPLVGDDCRFGYT